MSNSKERKMPNNNRSIFALLLLATAGLFASAASAQYSTPVRDVENPARTPFQSSTTITMDPPFAGVFGTPLFEVPVGRRAVIEYATARCSSPSGNPIVQVVVQVTELLSGGGSISRSFQIPVGFQGVDAFSGPLYIGGLTVRLYSDRGAAGGGVTAGASRSSGSGNASCTVTISGHTIAI
jgi:hypothetical protein